MATSNVEKTKLEAEISRAVELLRKLKNTPSYVNSNFSKGKDHNEKLEELEKILSSTLFNSVREVYEKVYDTIDVDGNSDVKSAAAARATIAVFSGSESHSHPRTINLPKSDEGFGFNIIGGKEQSSPIYISRILSGGIAESSNLRRGDQLLEINGINVENEYHEKAVKLLKNASGYVELKVRYMPDILEKIELRFDKKCKQTRKTR